jgi:hypothetical protein
MVSFIIILFHSRTAVIILHHPNFQKQNIGANPVIHNKIVLISSLWNTPSNYCLRIKINLMQDKSTCLIRAIDCQHAHWIECS